MMILSFAIWFIGVISVNYCTMKIAGVGAFDSFEQSKKLSSTAAHSIQFGLFFIYLLTGMYMFDLT